MAVVAWKCSKGCVCRCRCYCMSLVFIYDAVAHFKLEHKLLSMYLQNVELSLDSTACTEEIRNKNKTRVSKAEYKVN